MAHVKRPFIAQRIGSTFDRTRGRKWQAIRRSVLTESPLCVACLRGGTVRAADEVDHIKPLHQGGTDERDNLQALCSDCHARKTITERGDTYRAGCDERGFPLDPSSHWQN